jgi:hypothetical protein
MASRLYAYKRSLVTCDGTGQGPDLVWYGSILKINRMRKIIMSILFILYKIAELLPETKVTADHSNRGNHLHPGAA